MADTPPKPTRFTYNTNLWKNGENSFATTVPQDILALRGAPVENAEVEWSINQETGNVVAEFKERDRDAE